jgi:hypothetical protein
MSFFTGPCVTGPESSRLLPAVVGFVYVAQPPAIVSNLIYVGEFCDGSAFDALFGALATPVIGALRIVAENLPDCRWEKVRQFRAGG